MLYVRLWLSIVTLDRLVGVSPETLTVVCIVVFCCMYESLMVMVLMVGLVLSTSIVDLFVSVLFAWSVACAVMVQLPSRGQPRS